MCFVLKLFSSCSSHFLSSNGSSTSFELKLHLYPDLGVDHQFRVRNVCPI